LEKSLKVHLDVKRTSEEGWSLYLLVWKYI